MCPERKESQRKWRYSELERDREVCVCEAWMLDRNEERIERERKEKKKLRKVKRVH